MLDPNPSCFRTALAHGDPFRAVVERVYAIFVIAESSHSGAGVVTDFVVREVSESCASPDGRLAR